MKHHCCCCHSLGVVVLLLLATTTTTLQKSILVMAFGRAVAAFGPASRARSTFKIAASTRRRSPDVFFRINGEGLADAGSSSGRAALARSPIFASNNYCFDLSSTRRWMSSTKGADTTGEKTEEESGKVRPALSWGARQQDTCAMHCPWEARGLASRLCASVSGCSYDNTLNVSKHIKHI